MGLEEVVSPMRLRGMRAIMAAIRRGIRTQIEGGVGEGEMVGGSAGMDEGKGEVSERESQGPIGGRQSP